MVDDKDWNVFREKKPIKYIFDENKTIEELRQYVDNTYNAHYSKGKYQATEFIADSGHGEGFCIGNILKYAQRYGKKGSPKDHRKDLLKVIHYTITVSYTHLRAHETDS